MPEAISSASYSITPLKVKLKTLRQKDLISLLERGQFRLYFL